MPPIEIENAEVSIGCPPPKEGWKSFQFNLKKFKDLTTTKDHYVFTPKFSCNGHEWGSEIYPGGADDAADGSVSIYLTKHSEGSITANYEVTIMDKFGQKIRVRTTKQRFGDVEGVNKSWGWRDFIKRSAILDETRNIIDSDGALTVAVSIKEEPSDVFVPNNPILKTIQGMFLDEDTADVCFEVICSAEAKKGKKKKAKASGLFHAHHLILKTGAPMLADLFDLDDCDGKLATAAITDVKPNIFRHLLYYVYGGNVAEDELKANAKDIIDAADKYSIVNLKLESEAAYVKSTDITVDNAMENLLYADAKNCALLKEAVIDFLAENSIEAVEKISFDDVPGHMMKDLLVVFGRNGKKDESDTAAADELTTLRVSDLRRKLAEKGLGVDGSREAMIESIKNNSTKSDDDNNNGDGDDGENGADDVGGGDGGGVDEDD